MNWLLPILLLAPGLLSGLTGGTGSTALTSNPLLLMMMMGGGGRSLTSNPLMSYMLLGPTGLLLSAMSPRRRSYRRRRYPRTVVRYLPAPAYGGRPY